MSLHIHPHAAECPRRQVALGGRAEQARHLLDLAERCEQADGPDWALDHDIVAALDIAHQNRWALAENAGVTPNPYPLPRYTASLDAAMSLVPGPDWEWSLEICEGSLFYSPLDRQMVSTVEMGDPMRGWKAEAATPALALCAAALRARAAQ